MDSGLWTLRQQSPCCEGQRGPGGHRDCSPDGSSGRSTGGPVQPPRRMSTPNQAVAKKQIHIYFGAVAVVKRDDAPVVAAPAARPPSAYPRSPTFSVPVLAHLAPGSSSNRFPLVLGCRLRRLLRRCLRSRERSDGTTHPPTVVKPPFGSEPSYDRGVTIGAALLSVASQTFSPRSLRFVFISCSDMYGGVHCILVS